MSQVHKIDVDRFQKDTFAVFSKYGVGVNEGLKLLSSTKNQTVKSNKPIKKLKAKKIIDLKKVASPAFLKKFAESVKQLKKGKVVRKTMAELRAMEK